MLIGARRAAQLLTRRGVSAWSAQRVLASGLAGQPIRAGSAVLYDEERVTEPAERPSLRWPALDRDCPQGLFVSRRSFPATGLRPDQLRALSSGWSSVNPWAWVNMSLRLERYGYFPFVATLGGLVVVGADIVQTRGFSELQLTSPGPWFESVRGHWLPTGPGRPWFLTLGPPIAPELSPDAA